MGVLAIWARFYFYAKKITYPGVEPTRMYLADGRTNHYATASPPWEENRGRWGLAKPGYFNSSMTSSFLEDDHLYAERGAWKIMSEYYFSLASYSHAKFPSGVRQGFRSICDGDDYDAVIVGLVCQATTGN